MRKINRIIFVVTFILFISFSINLCHVLAQEIDQVDSPSLNMACTSHVKNAVEEYSFMVSIMLEITGMEYDELVNALKTGSFSEEEVESFYLLKKFRMENDLIKMSIVDGEGGIEEANIPDGGCHFSQHCWSCCLEMPWWLVVPCWGTCPFAV